MPTTHTHRAPLVSEAEIVSACAQVQRDRTQLAWSVARLRDLLAQASGGEGLTAERQSPTRDLIGDVVELGTED